MNLMKKVEKDEGTSSPMKGCKEGEPSCDQKKSKEEDKRNEKDAGE